MTCNHPLASSYDVDLKLEYRRETLCCNFHNLFNLFIDGERILEMLLSQIIDGVKSNFEQKSLDSTTPMLTCQVSNTGRSL